MKTKVFLLLATLLPLFPSAQMTTPAQQYQWTLQVDLKRAQRDNEQAWLALSKVQQDVKPSLMQFEGALYRALLASQYAQKTATWSVQMKILPRSQTAVAEAQQAQQLAQQALEVFRQAIEASNKANIALFNATKALQQAQQPE